MKKFSIIVLSLLVIIGGSMLYKMTGHTVFNSSLELVTRMGGQSTFALPLIAASVFMLLGGLYYKASQPKPKLIPIRSR